MSDKLSGILDMIATVTSDVDQAQARLNHNRLRFPNPEPSFIQAMDEAQAQIDAQRDQIEILKMKCKYL